MFLNSSLTGALDRIAERAADVRRAYTPGAVPSHDDVASPGIISDFTLDPLAVVAPEGCYFIGSDGGEKRIYTRDGAFSVHGGRLVNAEGQPILGLHAGSDSLADLRVDPVDEALGRVRDIAIDRDGTLAYRREYLDPRSGNRELQRVVVGTVALARFPAGTRLVPHDGGCSAPENVAAQISTPEQKGFPPLEPLRRERGRIDVDASLVRLKEAYLAFDALQAAEAAKAHVGKTAMDLLK
jgi:flagellar basal body rod protein FlgG